MEQTAKEANPKTHRAAVLQSPKDTVRITRVPTPQPTELKQGECLVKLAFSGVCHSDLHAAMVRAFVAALNVVMTQCHLQNDWPVKAHFPLIGGHEGVGHVVALGLGADEYVSVGDVVGLKYLADSCLNCAFCRAGAEAVCARASYHGFTRPGTFQEFCVTAARHATKVPVERGMDMAEASPLLCAGLTVWKALKVAGLTVGQTVAISGSGGGLGHLAVQYARAAGLRVIGIDTGVEKEELSRRLGVAEFVDFRKTTDLVEAVKAATVDGLGPDATIVAASGAKAYEQAMQYIRPTGVLVPVGLAPNSVIKLDVFWSVFQTKRVLPSYVGNRQDAVECLHIAADNNIKALFTVRPLSELPDIYDKMLKGEIAGRVVVDCSK
ncbi:alcohol dehydrogenase [Cladochytrium tenue]|nr:alcohol dehydrogenase [Cladochytrium tenue]